MLLERSKRLLKIFWAILRKYYQLRRWGLLQLFFGIHLQIQLVMITALYSSAIHMFRYSYINNLDELKFSIFGQNVKRSQVGTSISIEN